MELPPLSDRLQRDYPITPVPFTSVWMEDGFWWQRLERNRTVTIPSVFRKCEETGRIDNFAKAGGLKRGDFEGCFFNDSDVFKLIEGAAYSLSLHPDNELERYVDDIVKKIAAAQESDGYLYTARTLSRDCPLEACGPERWSNLGHSHELYNVGHLYEAAVAYYQGTGKRNLLAVAVKNADLICRVFGSDKRHDVPGHPEIELGLIRLYRTTSEIRYLNLARFFLEERGNRANRALYGSYCQDHLPVFEQNRAVGHAVRALYLYSAMTDVAALTEDPRYSQAISKLWRDVVGRKMYLTGGVGSRIDGESFGDAFELPNDTAYNETCAAIAHALWQYRLFLLHKDGQYLDVLERILYNGFVSGISLGGDRFLYPNPLEFDGESPFNQGSPTRQPWFDCSCCPVNIARFIPSIPGFLYGMDGASLYVNLYSPGNVTLEMEGNPIRVDVDTRYPWDGKIRLVVEPEEPGTFEILLRIPGWARGIPVPSDLYRYLQEGEARQSDAVSIQVNGESQPIRHRKGFASIRRRWTKGDCIEMNLPMPIRRVVAHPNVAADKGLVALERGPLVYCFEGVDHAVPLSRITLPDDAPLDSSFHPEWLGGMVLIQGRVPVLLKNDHKFSTRRTTVTALPYYGWGHRGLAEMRVWVKRGIES